jgi:transcriptional regulator with GAF, ATPase, and Fis domain
VVPVPLPKMDVGDLPRRITSSEQTVRPDNVSYRDAMDASRRELVLGALTRSQGNRAAAAKALGLHEKYLLRLIKSLGIG